MRWILCHIEHQAYILQRCPTLVVTCHIPKPHPHNYTRVLIQSGALAYIPVAAFLHMCWRPLRSGMWTVMYSSVLHSGFQSNKLWLTSYYISPTIAASCWDNGKTSNAALESFWPTMRCINVLLTYYTHVHNSQYVKYADPPRLNLKTCKH